jgi:RNA polymerase sigma factor (sigma-70 family)
LGCDALLNIESVSSEKICPYAAKHMNDSDSAMSKMKSNELSREDILRMYSEYAGSVYNFFFYSTGDRETAGDLVNDVFIKVLDKSGRYDFRKGSIKVWLFTIARNTLRDHLKSKRRSRSWLTIDEAKEVPEPGYTSPEETLSRKDEVLALTHALESLNKRERSLVSLKYGAGLRNKELAAMLGLSEKNVGVILCRALSKLRKQLAEGR